MEISDLDDCQLRFALQKSFQRENSNKANDTNVRSSNGRIIDGLVRPKPGYMLSKSNQPVFEEESEILEGKARVSSANLLLLTYPVFYQSRQSVLEKLVSVITMTQYTAVFLA